MILTKEQVDEAFGPCRTYNAVDTVARLFALVIPDWGKVKKVGGYPRCGREIHAYIVHKFVLFDQARHPGTMAGFTWLNYGWSCKDELGPWEVDLADAEIEYGDEDTGLPPPVVEPEPIGGYERDRRIIRGWDDMKRHGFIHLTGESCGIGMRSLIDLTETGCRIVESFFSTTIERGNNWNHSDGQVASIMLSGSVFQDLAAFALLRDGYDVVVVVDHVDKHYSSQYVAGMTRDEFCDRCESIDQIAQGHYRIYNAAGTANGGLRNTHVMSGRTR